MKKMNKPPHTAAITATAFWETLAIEDLFEEIIVVTKV